MSAYATLFKYLKYLTKLCLLFFKYSLWRDGLIARRYLFLQRFLFYVPSCMFDFKLRTFGKKNKIKSFNMNKNQLILKRFKDEKFITNLQLIYKMITQCLDVKQNKRNWFQNFSLNCILQTAKNYLFILPKIWEKNEKHLRKVMETQTQLPQTDYILTTNNFKLNLLTSTDLTVIHFSGISEYSIFGHSN